MVSRHLSGHRFVCLTHRPLDGIDCIVRKDLPPIWWAKLLFFSGQLEMEYPMLYLDLDMLIVGPLEKLEREVFTGYRQTKRIVSKKTFPLINTSAFFLPEPGPLDIWCKFTSKVMEDWRGDQDWIGYLHPEINMWPDCYFKFMEKCKDGPPPKDCIAVVCNTIENHQAVQEYPWTRDVWV